MAKEIATKEFVFAAADQLLNDGVAVTIKSVQSRVGGGSFTTVKRYLDEWITLRGEAEVQAADLPDHLSTIVNRVALDIWCIAKSEAQVDVARLQKEMHETKAAQESELQEVLEELRRLEKQEFLRIEEMRMLSETLRESELRNAALSERLRAAEAVQDELLACRDELRVSQEKLMVAVADAARLQGQMIQTGGSTSRKRELRKPLVTSGEPSSEGLASPDTST